jgi:AraC-like DNA-binding protein
MKRPNILSRSPELLAGFIAVRPEPEVPELVMVGEQWGAGGQFIGEHTHDIWEFYYQVSGESVWRVRSEEWALQTGGLMVMPPGVPHRMAKRQEKDHHYYFVGVDVSQVTTRLKALPDVFRGSTALRCDAMLGVAPAFAALVREVSLIKSARPLGLRISLDMLVLEVGRAMESLRSGERPERAFAWHPGVERAVGMIRQDPGRDWSVEALARLAGLSEGHLTELFKTHVGCAPHQFILQTRLERVRELVEESDLSLTQMAMELGFSSSQHLSSAFRKQFGRAPRTLRKRTR